MDARTRAPARTVFTLVLSALVGAVVPAAASTPGHPAADAADPPGLRDGRTTIPAARAAGLLPAAARADSSEGGRLYRAVCAGCHGVDGTGADPGKVAFQTPLPDFTDCSFATREPNADWAAVTHVGGPARGFSRTMPAFGKALSPDQVEQVLDHIRGFCPDDAWPRGELNLPRPMVTEKAYPEDEVVFTTGVDVEGAGAVTGEFVYEKRFGARNQLELVLPFGFRQREPTPEDPRDDWTSGLGDMAVGVKRAVHHDLESGTIVSLTAEAKLPTGDEDSGFGAGTTIFEPFLSLGQLLPLEGFLHAQTGLEVPAEADAADTEGFWRAALGRSFSQGDWGRVWSPMVEVLGKTSLESGEPTEWTLVPQLQVTLNTRQHVMANVALRVPVSQTDERSTEVMVYLLWDWFDGGFFEGW